MFLFDIDIYFEYHENVNKNVLEQIIELNDAYELYSKYTSVNIGPNKTLISKNEKVPPFYTFFSYFRILIF